MSATVTALEVQPHQTDRVSVYLDGVFAFGLPAVEAARLQTGQVLSDQEVAVLRALDQQSRAFDQAVLLLARRPHSTAEIRRYLASKQVTPPVIQAVLDRLERLGYIDDGAFVAYWIESRARFRPRGPRALRYELHQKGIAPDLITAALGEFDAHAAAYRAAQQKIARLRGLGRSAFRDKLGGFLTRRGFGYDIVRDVLDHVMRELEEEHPDYFASEFASEIDEE